MDSKEKLRQMLNQTVIGSRLQRARGRHELEEFRDALETPAGKWCLDNLIDVINRLEVKIINGDHDLGDREALKYLEAMALNWSAKIKELDKR